MQFCNNNNIIGVRDYGIMSLLSSFITAVLLPPLLGFHPVGGGGDRRKLPPPPPKEFDLIYINHQYKSPNQAMD